jgi:hypothetical protein
VTPERTNRFTVAGAVCVVGGLVVFRWSEARVTRFLPPCPFHACTGLYCPGCGSTRATRALLHGHLAAAWHDNPLFVLSIPILAVILLSDRYGSKSLSQSPRFCWGVLIVIVLFGVLRNLPYAPFDALAPHGL